MTIRVENVVDYANRKAIEAIRHLPPSGHRLRVFADAWKRANIEYLEFYKREGVGPEDAEGSEGVSDHADRA